MEEAALDPGLVSRVREVVSRHTRRTPLLPSEWLSRATGRRVFLKCEGLQRTGSFKVRGAVAALELLSPQRRARGVVTASAGNHGLGLAYAARIFGAPCIVVVPRDTPRVKVEGIRSLGARVLRSPHPGFDETQAWTLAHPPEPAAAFVSPFEDTGVMAGNGGTTYLEIAEQASGLDTLVVPCGGGGLANGLGMMAEAAGAGAPKVFGINTEASPGMWLSRRDGRAHPAVESAPTIAEGIEGGVSELTYRLGLRWIDEVLAVPETAIRRAVVDVLCRERLVIEGAAAAGVAAVLAGRVPGERIGVILTGSNIDPDRLAGLMRESRF